MDKKLLYSKLQSIVQKRQQPTRSKVLHQIMENFTSVTKKKYSVKTYAITILFPHISLEESWDQINTRADDILKALQDSKLPLAYITLSIEVHRLSNKKKAKKQLTENQSTNKMLGKAHIHINLALFNDFLCPDTDELLDELQTRINNPADIQIKELDATAAKKWFLYTVKETKDKEFQLFVKTKTKLATSCIFINYLSVLSPQCEQITRMLNTHKYEVTFIDKGNKPDITPIPFTDDEQVRITWYLAALMEENKYKILKTTQEVYQLVESSQHTYRKAEIDLPKLFSFLWAQFPKHSVKLLRQASSWVLKTQKNLELNLLPAVFMDPQLVELSDSIYDFRTSIFYINQDKSIQQDLLKKLVKNHNHIPKNVEDLHDVSCSSFWENESFQQITWPENTLNFLQVYCSRDYQDFLYRFGSLFQERTNKSLTLFIHGESGTGKTLVGDYTLTDVISEANVGHIVNTKQNAFRFADVLDKWVTMLNDFRWHLIDESTLLNYLEGNHVMINTKYKTAKKWKPGHVVITSNEELPSSSALSRRVDSYEFKKENQLISQEQRATFSNVIRKEALGFAILSNIVHLNHYKDLRNIQLPDNWTQDETIRLELKRLLQIKDEHFLDLKKDLIPFK